MQRVPDEAEVRQAFSFLLPEHCIVEPHLMNLDVDAMMFRFKELGANSTIPDGGLRQRVTSRALSAGWEIVETGDEVLTFEFVEPFRHGGWSLEAIKVVARSGGWCYVGYVQIDLRERPQAPMRELNGDTEAGWAERYWWPKFRSYAGLQPAS